jgi:hypothetical protein
MSNRKYSAHVADFSDVIFTTTKIKQVNAPSCGAFLPPSINDGRTSRMELLTILFVFILLFAALWVTLSVRRDFIAREEIERERQHRTQHPHIARKR